MQPGALLQAAAESWAGDNGGDFMAMALPEGYFLGLVFGAGPSLGCAELIVVCLEHQEGWELLG